MGRKRILMSSFKNSRLAGCENWLSQFSVNFPFLISFYFFNILYLFSIVDKVGTQTTQRNTHRNFISRVTRAQLFGALIHRPPWNAALRPAPSPGLRLEALRPTGLPRPLELLLLWKAHQFRKDRC